MDLTTEYNVTNNSTVNMSLEDIMIVISSIVSNKKFVEFVKVLERDYFSDWGVSEELYEYYKKQHEIYLSEVEEEDN